MAHPHIGARRSAMPGENSAGLIYRELHESVRGRLADLERLSIEPDEPTSEELARAELPKLIAGLRALLEAHQPDAKGHCASCRRHLLRRRSPSPCRAYLSTYLCLLLAGDPPAASRKQTHGALRRAG